MHPSLHGEEEAIALLARSYLLFHHQTYALTDGRFIDLDGFDASFLEVNHFIPQSQSKLLRLQLAGHVSTGEGPIQDGDWTSQHAFHWLISDALSVAAPLYCHRPMPADVRNDDRGPHITFHNINAQS